MVWYTSRVPTWTTALDAVAVARIGASIGKENLPPLRPRREIDMMKLKEIDVTIGVVDEKSSEKSGAGIDIGASGVVGQIHRDATRSARRN